MRGIRWLGRSRTAPARVGELGAAVALCLAGCASPAPQDRAERAPEVKRESVATPDLRTTPDAEPTPHDQPSPQPQLLAQPLTQPSIVRLPNGIVVDRSKQRVEIPAHVAQTAGFLEQIACGENSREHESLLVVSLNASEIHAALLLVGATPGKPGSWRVEGEAVRSVPPTGTPIRVRVRVPGERSPTSDDPPGPPVERDIAEWVRGRDGRVYAGSWVFAGSRFAPNPKSWKAPGEHYVADFTGSIVGLVTFGDETIAATSVIPDLVEFEAAEWQAWTERIPFSGTEATLILDCSVNPATPPASS